MLTQVSSVVDSDAIIMPDVDLVRVRSLIDGLTGFEQAGQMSFDDVAKLSSLLPETTANLGIESMLSYESSPENLKLAHEALSKGVKATLAAVLAAAVAIIVRFFKYRKSSDYQKGGADGSTKGTASSAEAYRKEIMKTSPVLEKQVEEFRAHMEYFSIDVGLDAMDGDVYPELIGYTSSLSSLVKRFTNKPVPVFERSRDKARMGELLNDYAQLLAPGQIRYQWTEPYNFFFMTAHELHPHTQFLENLFHFIRVNNSFGTTIPELTSQLALIRFQPNRVTDHEGPNAEVYVERIRHIIENNFAPAEMAEAVGISPSMGDNFSTFLNIADRFKEHIAKLFGNDIYNETAGDDEFRQKRMREYYEFLTTDTRNVVGETWTAVTIMVDQCAELLKVAEDVMIGGRKTNFMAEAKAATEALKSRYDREMRWTTETSKHYTSQQVDNFAEMKKVGVFITTLTRFVADFTRIVDYMTRWDDRLDKLESDMVQLCKQLIEVNKILRKVKE